MSTSFVVRHRIERTPFPRCEFLLASSDDLSVVDESVNVLMTRSTLIYLHDKARTLREFFRVLRRGGRLSMFEPINSFAWPEHEKAPKQPRTLCAMSAMSWPGSRRQALATWR
jgi:ubiquinone/menaquinone biosynthesis C-methylase UbiE